MKKLLVILSFFFVSNVVAQTQSLKNRVEEIVVGHDKYKIAIKYSPSGTRIYIPMRKVFNGAKYYANGYTVTLSLLPDIEH